MNTQAAVPRTQHAPLVELLGFVASPEGAQLVTAVAVGVVAGGFVYVGLGRAAQDGVARRALAVASFALGGLLSFWLWQHPTVLGQFVDVLVTRTLAVTLAAVAAALIFWKVRSWFLS